jgi:ABC-2 type transport system ATP-binding protein
MREARLRLDAVGKRYGLTMPWVVRDVSLEIRPGGLVRLEGRNGSGKSTLLRVIAGVSTPSQGLVSGRPVTGFVPERFPATLPFPAREYLMHVGRVHGLAHADLTTRIQLCLDKLGGWEFVDVPLRNMSKGMCQKVAVAQALLPGSGLLVLDEAWTGLDVEARAALDEVVAERLADGGSVVFVDHDPTRLEHLGAERWRIEEGRARQVASPGGQASASGATAAGTEADVPAHAGVAPGTAGPGEAGPTAEASPSAEAGESVAAAADSGEREASPPPVVIEVDCYPPGAAEPGSLPGVLSADKDGERLTVAVIPGESDSVLRVLLGAGEGVHVVGVRAAEAGQ